MKIKKVAIIGQGQFGRFMGSHLEQYFEVLPFLRLSDPVILEDCDVVIFAVPFSGLEAVIKKVKKHIRTDAIVIDVCSVKQKPITLLKRHFKTQQILGTHPVFGPQSGKNGIEGLPIVLCNVSCTKPLYKKIVTFFKRHTYVTNH